MSAEALTASRQAISHAKAAMPQGAETYVPRLNDATEALERRLNAEDPTGCARAAAVPATHPPLALCGHDGSVIPLPEGAFVDLGRTGLLRHHIPATATLVSRTHASLVRGGDDFWVVVRGQGPVGVVSPQMTYRLVRPGDKVDVGIGYTIVLSPDAAAPHNFAFKLIEAHAPMEVEAPTAGPPELAQPPAAVDQAQARALASGAPSMTAPRRVPVLALASTLAAPVGERLDAPTQRVSPRVEPPQSPLEKPWPMEDVEEALLGKQLTKKSRAAGGAVEAKIKFPTPAEDRRARKERHRAVSSELAGHGMTAPEASVEAALYANGDDVSDACMWLLDPTRMEEFSVRRI
jgi:hypothetical protein